MCRILAYRGPAVTLDRLLTLPPHSLERQAHAPRHQTPGRINADGWGVGWYDPAVRSAPARYRTATPMWADTAFAEVAPLVRSGTVVAAVRNASPGAPVEETGSSPFVAGDLLFTHNGYVDGFRGPLGVTLRRSLSERRAAGILGAADSEVVFAMVLDRIDGGTPLADAVVGVIADLRTLTDGKFNVLVCDGRRVVATRAGNSLFTRSAPASALVPGTVGDPAEDAVAHAIASEPWDDDPGWTAVPDSSLVLIDPDGDLTIAAL
jgi:glutamine amidotransferase